MLLALSFCKDVETFRHEMDQANHMNFNTRAYQNRKNNKHKIPHQKTTEEILENYNEYETIRMKSIAKAFEKNKEICKIIRNPYDHD